MKRNGSRARAEGNFLWRNGLINPGVVMRYRYYDKSGVLLTTVDVAKTDCIERKL